MKLNQLRRIEKRYFGYEELARVLDITPASARVAAGRFVRQACWNWMGGETAGGTATDLIVNCR